DPRARSFSPFDRKALTAADRLNDSVLASCGTQERFRSTPVLNHRGIGLLRRTRPSRILLAAENIGHTPRNQLSSGDPHLRSLLQDDAEGGFAVCFFGEDRNSLDER